MAYLLAALVLLAIVHFAYESIIAPSSRNDRLAGTPRGMRQRRVTVRKQ